LGETAATAGKLADSEADLKEIKALRDKKSFWIDYNLIKIPLHKGLQGKSPAFARPLNGKGGNHFLPGWSWWDSNPRPNMEYTSFLHA